MFVYRNHMKNDEKYNNILSFIIRLRYGGINIFSRKRTMLFTMYYTQPTTEQMSGRWFCR